MATLNSNLYLVEVLKKILDFSEKQSLSNRRSSMSLGYIKYCFNESIETLNCKFTKKSISILLMWHYV